MEFDINKVYTAVNADELKIGSKCIFAYNLQELRLKILEGERYIRKLDSIYDDDTHERFVSGLFTFGFAYLIEPSKEPEYKPFSSTEKAMEAIKKHGGWVKEKRTGDLKLITSVNGSYKIYSIGMGGTYYKPQVLLECYVFADDGTPCGELVE